jgi:hypothetical protein
MNNNPSLTTASLKTMTTGTISLGSQGMTAPLAPQVAAREVVAVTLTVVVVEVTEVAEVVAEMEVPFWKLSFKEPVTISTKVRTQSGKSADRPSLHEFEVAFKRSTL